MNLIKPLLRKFCIKISKCKRSIDKMCNKLWLLNLRSWVNYHRLAICTTIVIITTVVLIVFFDYDILSINDELKIHFSNVNKLSNISINSINNKKLPFIEILGFMGVLITAAVTYSSHSRDVKMRTLADYNKRFSESYFIKDITLDMINTINSAEHEYCMVRFSKYCMKYEYELELFYRFFEELELNIEKGILKRKDVYNLFAYYAMYGIESPIFKPSEYPENWILLKNFEIRMKPLYSKDNRKPQDNSKKGSDNTK